MSQERFERYELKYFIYPDEMGSVRSLVEPFMHIDKYANGFRNGRYTVRSIYFDTPTLRFYHEKDAGTQIRKKLRVRTYNRFTRDAVSFLEIKRKYGNAIYKERVKMPWLDALTLLKFSDNCAGPKLLTEMRLTHASRTSTDRFLSLMRLRPRSLRRERKQPHPGYIRLRCTQRKESEARRYFSGRRSTIYE